MEPALFNNFLCNVSTADSKLTNQVKRQSIVQCSLTKDNKNNTSNFWMDSQVATFKYCMRSNDVVATKEQSFS